MTLLPARLLAAGAATTVVLLVVASCGATRAGGTIVAWVGGTRPTLVVAHPDRKGCTVVYRIPATASDRLLYQGGSFTFVDRGDLFSVSPSGSVRRVSLAAKQAAAGVWSPTGDHVAVGGPRLSIFSATSQRAVVTAPPTHARASYLFPSWSVGRDGSDLRQLSDPVGADDILPRWSPDSRSLAFSRYPTGFHSAAADVYIVDAHRPGPMRLTRTPTRRNSSVVAGTDALSWSPDGKQLLLARHNRLATIASGGGHVSTLCALGKDTFPDEGAWLP